MDSPRGLIDPARATLVMILVACALCHCGGGSARTKDPDPEAIRSAFGKPDPEPPQGLAWRVYLDGSRSMQGFPRARRTFENVLRDLADFLAAKAGQSPVSFFRFGPGVEVLTSNQFLGAGSQPDYYGFPRTDIGAVLSEVAPKAWGSKPRSTVPAAVLIITDGVQSLENTNSPDLIEPVSRWLSWGYEFGIIGVRSEFNGTAYSETRRERRLGEALGTFRTGGDTSRFRPFYVFVLTTRPGLFDEILGCVEGRGLRNRLVRDLELSQRAFSSNAERVTGGRARGQANVVKVRRCSRDRPVVAYLAWAGDKKATGPGQITIRLEVEPEPSESEMLSDSLLCDVDAEALIYGGTTKSGLTAAVTATRTARRKVGKADRSRITMDCELNLDDFTPAGKHAAKLALCLTPQSLRAPAWVSDFSTSRDDYLSYYNKTMYFDRLFRNLMNVREFSRQPVAEVYLYLHKPSS